MEFQQGNRKIVIWQPISKDQKDKFLSDIGYSSVQLNEDLLYIKEWLKQQSHLPPSRLTEKDEFLMMYLTGCKGKLDKVKAKLDAYYSIRNQSEIFNVRDPLDPKYSIIKDIVYSSESPRTTDNGIRIINIALATSDVTYVDLFECIKKFINMAELHMRLDDCSIGMYVVADCQFLTVAHLLKIKLRNFKDGINFIQNILPFRIAGIYLFNVPHFIDIAINNIILPLVPKKLRIRVHVTSGGIEELSKPFNIDLLPKDFGGSEATLKELSRAWTEREISERGWYLNELSEHTDESKRIKEDQCIGSYYLGIPNRIKLIFDSIVPNWGNKNNY